ncbi:MAG TPA: PAS domain S-box protein [Candidatus Acidoferrales bacterium]|nr:PAS domain S-box protein [Candidatus Acidoferrales bacterium]
MKRVSAPPAPPDGCFEGLLAEFSATIRELSPSVGRQEFTQRLTSRVAETFRARAAALVLGRNREWEIAAWSGRTERWEPQVQRRLAVRLGGEAGRLTEHFLTGAASALLGAELAGALGWRDVFIVRLTGSDQELLGLLCLVDPEGELSGNERRLLDALAGYASVALENVRLFSRIERSRKQWVEDVDAISDFIVVHDSAFRVLRLNRALADLLGVPPTGVVGNDIGSLAILGTSGEGGRCPFCRNLKVPHEEFIHTTSDRTYLVSTSRIHAAEDEGARTVHVLKDITDRREAERRYRRERDFNRNILNNTQSMILVVDTAGLVSYLNRRCLEAGYGREELLGRPLIEMVPAARRPILAEALERALSGAALDNLETPISRGNGTTGQFSVSLSPMRDEQGDINSVVAVMTDVTDAAELQAKLMHTEKMAALGQLVSGVAHEVNNPLAAIVGFADLLLENPAIPSGAKEELRVILQEAQRTRGIVQNLLSFARHMPAQREPVQINALLEQVVKLRAYDSANHRIELVENYQDDLPLLAGDPHRLQQVFLNILNNAYDAIAEVGRPGRIEIATEVLGSEIEIRLSDNGPGISHPERIFDPFFTTKEVGKGTGLGLSICYGIVRAHQGEIVAENHANGSGCTFTVRLPIATKGVEVFAAEAAP